MTYELCAVCGKETKASLNGEALCNEHMEQTCNAIMKDKGQRDVQAKATWFSRLACRITGHCWHKLGYCERCGCDYFVMYFG